MGPDATVVPRSVYSGYRNHSFGQKKVPSDIAAALLATVLVRVEALADEIASVDVLTLASSRGGSGTALPPR